MLTVNAIRVLIFRDTRLPASSINLVKFCGFILLFWVLMQPLKAQDLRDFETWTSAEFRYKPSKKWRIGIEAQLRLKDNSSEIDGYITELTGRYEIFKNFQVLGGFRLIRKNDNTGRVQGYENYVRLHADAMYSHKLSRLGLNYRLRYQTRDELGVSNEQGDFADQYFRLKIGTKYDFRKWKLDPQLSAEIFHHSEKTEVNEFNKFRVTFGTEYKFDKWGRIGVFYRYEQEINTQNPRSTDIIRIQYVYTLKGY